MPKLSELIRTAADLIDVEGDIEVFFALYTPEDAIIMNDDLCQSEAEEVIEALNVSDQAEDSIKDLIESASARILARKAQQP